MDMKTIEETRRGMFEAWAIENGYEVHHVGRVSGDYIGGATAIAWQAFNAALDAVVIELPDTVENTGTLTSSAVMSYKRETIDAIESTNLGLKIR
jgi:hypothetical protein